MMKSTDCYKICPLVRIGPKLSMHGSFYQGLTFETSSDQVLCKGRRRLVHQRIFSLEANLPICDHLFRFLVILIAYACDLQARSRVRSSFGAGLQQQQRPQTRGGICRKVRKKKHFDDNDDDGVGDDDNK